MNITPEKTAPILCALTTIDQAAALRQPQEA